MKGVMAWRDTGLAVKAKHVLLPMGNGTWDSHEFWNFRV